MSRAEDQAPIDGLDDEPPEINRKLYKMVTASFFERRSSMSGIEAEENDGLKEESDYDAFYQQSDQSQSQKDVVP